MRQATLSEYRAFLAMRQQRGAQQGFEPTFLPDFLFDFQGALVEWALLQGRAALLEDCGLGKSVQEMVWGENVARHTAKPVLILTPLAVAQQFVREGEKFDIGVTYAGRQADVKGAGVYVTNYEKLHHFIPDGFGGVVCDESSILKHFGGVRQRAINEFLRRVRYRLLGTATAAPNDYTELGTSSEALGYLGHVDMLSRFFKNDLNNVSTGRGYLGKRNAWRFRGHAEVPFWRWVSSWARAVRCPSDLGFDDGAFHLPDLIEEEHIVEAKTLPDGWLFAVAAATREEQIEERRRTIAERCERVAELVSHSQPAAVWCHLNPEGDLLERLISGAVQVSGSDSDDAKEEKLLAFANGEARVLVTKPKIGAWGLNFQHCAHTAFFADHSYEQYYQAVRRFWRFGQVHSVRVDLIATEGQRGVLANLQRKAGQADRMFSRLVAAMNDALSVDRTHDFTKTEEVPAWL